MSEIIPTIGRIVYFVGNDGEIRPAIITHVWSSTCINLQVFGKDNADTFAGIKTSVVHNQAAEGEAYRIGSWHWMPYQVGQAKAAAALTDPQPTPA